MATKEILEDLVSIHSTFPNEAKLGAYVEKYLRSHGFATKRQYIQPGRFNLLAERGKGKRAMLFYCHMDTVPIYGNWKTNPLKLTKKADQLFGLGSCDMKGGLAAVLQAAGEKNDRKIKLLFCADEENISKGVWTAVQKNKKWFSDVFFALSAEPGISSKQTGGENVITAGRRGRTVIAIDIQGLSSHGAMPTLGISAIDEAAKITYYLKKFELRRHPKLGNESIFVRVLESRATSLSIPDKAHMELDVALVPPSTVKDTKKRVESLISWLRQKKILNPKTIVKVSVKQRETPYIEPYMNQLGNGVVKKAAKLVKKNSREPVWNYGLSVADDNVLFNSMHAPVLTIGPRGGNEHTANEWVSERSLAKLTELYRLLINEL